MAKAKKKVKKSKKAKISKKKSKAKKIKAIKKACLPAGRPKGSKEKVVGKVEHIFDKINVITMTLKNPLKAGDVIHIKGYTTDFVQTVDSMQIEHESVQKAKKGDGIGIKVKDTVRDTDTVYFADKKTAAAFKSGVAKPVINPIIPQQAAQNAPQQTKFISF